MTDRGISIIGEKATAFYGLLALRGSVGLELKGLKLSRGRSATAIAKQRFDLPRGWRKEKVYEWLNQHIKEIEESPEFEDIRRNIHVF